MFGKKEKFPAMPQHPSVEAMLQDIKDASNEDPVFKFSFDDTTNSEGSIISSLSDEDDNENANTSRKKSQLTTEEAYSYEKMKVFVEQNSQMKLILDKLLVRCEQLNSASTDLTHRLQSSREQFLNKNL